MLRHQSTDDPQAALRQYWPHIARQTTAVTPVSGGVSGQPVYRVSTPDGDYSLKAPPLSKNAQAMLSHAARADLRYVPRVVPPVEADCPWQLLEWLAGIPGDNVESGPFARAAGRTLAELHMSQLMIRREPSPAVAHRATLLGDLRMFDAAAWRRRFDKVATPLDRGWPNPSQLVALVERVHGRLVAVSDQHWPLQLCWGDARRENFLHVDGRITGIVDFATVTVDSPMLDLARLAGSFAVRESRRAAVAAYESVPLLTDSDRVLAELLDASGTLVALHRWLDWDVPGRTQRLHHLCGRLADLASSTAWP